MKKVRFLAPFLLSIVSLLGLGVKADADTVSSDKTVVNSQNDFATSLANDDEDFEIVFHDSPTDNVGQESVQHVTGSFDGDVPDGFFGEDQDSQLPADLEADENVETYMAILNNLMYLDSFRNRALDKTIYQFALEREYFTKSEVNNMRNFLISEEMDDALFSTIVEHPEIYDQIKVVDINADEDAGAPTYLNPDQSGRVYKFTFLFDKNIIIGFTGTAGDQEWNDNFNGAKESDTEGQKKALDYFNGQVARYGYGRDVYVTGHSKGGNKSMYIGIVAGDKVNHVYSFDGQGFGQPFIDRYKNSIDRYGRNLTNISTDDDFVNTSYIQVADNQEYVTSSNGWGLLNGLVNLSNVPGDQFFDAIDNNKIAMFLVGLVYTRTLGTHAPSSLMEVRDGEIQLSELVEQNEVMKLVDVFMSNAQTWMSVDDYYDMSLLLSGAIISRPDLYNPNNDPAFNTSIVVNLFRTYVTRLISSPNIFGLVDFLKGMGSMVLLAFAKPELFSISLDHNYIMFIIERWIGTIILTAVQVLPNLTVDQILTFVVDMIRLVFAF